MLKAILQYTDISNDCSRVFKGLADNGALILKTVCKRDRHKVTVIVKDSHHLNDIVSKLNAHCYYGVIVVKTKMLKSKEPTK